MGISLSQATQLVTVYPETVVTIQQLLNGIRAWEDNQENMDCGQVAEAAGKQVLSETASVGVTLKLLNWKITFGDRGSPVVCTVTDGNLVAIDGYGDPMSPIEPATNVTVVVAQSSSATIANVAQIEADQTTIKNDISTIQGGISSIDTNVDTIDTNIGTIQGSVSTIQGDIGMIDISVGSIDTNVGGIQSDVGSIETDLAFIKQIESGRWKVINKQMIFYDANDDPLITFNLKDKEGNLTEGHVYERVPV